MNRISNIIFMGTPDFAVPALKALVENRRRVSLVVTQPDRPSGRGRKVLPPAVKKFALKTGLPFIQPDSIKSDASLEKIASYEPDLFVVVAYGRVLPKKLLALPPDGTINIHASLLPKYRGPAPIQWAIINREKQTGVTAMFMDEGLDTGDILSAKKTDITPSDTSSSLHDRLALLGAELLIETLRHFEAGQIKPVAQDPHQASYAPMLKKTDGCIDWKKPPEVLEAFIKGMNPWPGAFTFHAQKRLKILKARTLPGKADQLPGTVLKGFAGELRIAAGGGVISITEIQGDSGKRLSAEAFLRGYDLPPGSLLL